MVNTSDTRIRALILLLCGCFTISLAAGTQRIADRRAESAYRSVVEDSRDALQTRLESYLLSLDGLAAFLTASDRVTEAEWGNYVDTLDTSKTLPGVLGLGFIAPVTGPELVPFLEQVRSDGEPELVIHPETGRPEKMVIRFISPRETNIAARGLDIAFESNRRSAAIAARDTGLPRLTGPIALVQGENNGPGALLLRPVYAADTTPGDTAARRAVHLGWVYAPFFAREALTGMTASQGSLFELTVSDGDDALLATATAPAQAGRRVISEDLSAFGRTWTLTWTSTQRFDHLHRSFAPLVVLGAGLLSTLLLWHYLRSLARRDALVRALVDSKTRALSDQVVQNRSVIENSVFGVIELDSDGTIVAANPAAVRIIGSDDDLDLNGRRLADLIHVADPAPADIQRTTVGQGAGLRHIEMQANIWHRTDGALRQSVLLRDVTAETLSHAAVAAAEQRWTLALSGAEIGVFDVDLVQGTSVVSQTWRQLMDVPEDADIDTQAHFMSRIHPDDIAGLQAADRDAISGIAPRSISEYRVRFSDGAWRWMRSDAVVVARDVAGRALRLIGSQTDITALRTAQQALRHSEELLRLVIDRAPVGTAILDRDGCITRSNAALSHLTGYDAADLVGRRLRALLPDTDRDRALAALDELHGKPDRTYRSEHQIQRADGEIRWGLVKVTWAIDPARDVEIYIVQINDITQEKRSELVKSEFIATISHELRTPLTSIKGALGLMAAQRAGEPAGPGHRLMEIANTNTDRLIALVNDILDLEKISAGKMEFRIAPYVAAQLVEAAVEQNRPLLIRSDLTLRVEDGSAGAQVMVDDTRLSQVLGNLLSNATKFAPPGSEIVVGIVPDGDLLKFSVTDTGPGVPYSFRDRIFTPFSQADSSDTRKKGGTGLGLNISRQMVERMGGTIGFESVPGVRTTFHFTCPRRAGSSLALPPCESRRPLKTILHLEDDADFAEIIRYSLADVAEVTTAATLVEARRCMNERRFDLILVDWTLRDGAATCLLDELIAAQPHVRIVALSSIETSLTEHRVDHAMLKSRDHLSSIVASLRDEMDKTVAA